MHGPDSASIWCRLRGLDRVTMTPRSTWSHACRLHAAACLSCDAPHYNCYSFLHVLPTTKSRCRFSNMAISIDPTADGHVTSALLLAYQEATKSTWNVKSSKWRILAHFYSNASCSRTTGASEIQRCRYMDNVPRKNVRPFEPIPTTRLARKVE